MSVLVNIPHLPVLTVLAVTVKVRSDSESHNQFSHSLTTVAINSKSNRRVTLNLRGLQQLTATVRFQLAR
jgi:hypothetical protein